MKKGLIATAIFALTLGLAFATSSIADSHGGKGPEVITLQATVDAAAKPKPALFPHAKHQEKLTCADCHHSKDADGKQVAYVEGQAIEKCESCHYTAAGMEKKIATFKDAAHTNCKGCHTATDKALAKCNVCHSL